MSDSENLTLQERLQGLANLLPACQEREEPQQSSPYPVSSAPLVYQFQQAAYDYGWVQGVNYIEWMKSQEAIELRDNPAALAHATDEQLVYLITFSVRGERFFSGSLEACYRSGRMIAILRRAASLLEEIKQENA